MKIKVEKLHGLLNWQLFRAMVSRRFLKVSLILVTKIVYSFRIMIVVAGFVAALLLASHCIDLFRLAQFLWQLGQPKLLFLLLLLLLLPFFCKRLKDIISGNMMATSLSYFWAPRLKF